MHVTSLSARGRLFIQPICRRAREQGRNRSAVESRGERDFTSSPAVPIPWSRSETVAEGRDVYAALGVPAANIVFEDQSGPAANAGHSWVTKNFGGKCSANNAPYINDCGYDQAGAELTAIYGPDLKPPAAAPPAGSSRSTRREFVPDKASASEWSHWTTGYLYVPKDCEPDAQTPCRLQIVLHGCGQSAEVLGDDFYTKIGLNEWADANRIVVLYPQAHATTVAELPASPGLTALTDANPDGCWNWWGYAADTHYLTMNGVQLRAIWDMVRGSKGNEARASAAWPSPNSPAQTFSSSGAWVLPDSATAARAWKPVAAPYESGAPPGSCGRSLRNGRSGTGRFSSPGRKSRRVGGARDPDRHGGRARPRQSGLHRAPGEPDRRTPAGPGAHTRPVARARVPPGAARFGGVIVHLTDAAGHRVRAGLFRARPAVACGRPVPCLEGDDRDPPPRRPGRRG